MKGSVIKTCKFDDAKAETKVPAKAKRGKPLTKKRIRAFMRKLRKTLFFHKKQAKTLNRITEYAERQAELIQHRQRFRGKYREGFAAIGRNISRTFYADEGELASCFGVTENTIREWRFNYPEFSKGIKGGRQAFHRNRYSRYRYDKRIHPDIAFHICAEFDPEFEKLAACFGIEPSTLKKWCEEHPELERTVRYGRAFGKHRRTIENSGQLDAPGEDSGEVDNPMEQTRSDAGNQENNGPCRGPEGQAEGEEGGR